jgi:hypothetical protein
MRTAGSWQMCTGRDHGMWHTLQDHERSRFQDAGAKSPELIPLLQILSITLGRSPVRPSAVVVCRQEEGSMERLCMRLT